MSILSLEEFIAYHKKYGRSPLRGMSFPPNMNDKKYQSKYREYERKTEHKREKEKADLIKKQEKPLKQSVIKQSPVKSKPLKKPLKQSKIKIKQSYFVDEAWDKLREQMKSEKPNHCCLYFILTPSEKLIFEKKSSGCPAILDPAHVLPKSSYPHLKYRIENVYPLSRFAHSNLDSNKSPVTGKPITQIERWEWWDRILEPYNLSVEQLRDLNLSLTT